MFGLSLGKAEGQLTAQGVRAAGWALPYSGDDPGREGEWWLEVLWASRKNACHHMGFVVKVVGVSPFSRPSIWHWGLLVWHTSAKAVLQEAHPVAQAPAGQEGHTRIRGDR